ncbi:MAG: MATE family efflux transporter [Rhizobiales bacterium 65-9]|nr:MATE family efflux transporter [Hyphomicrobiales bacterium]OJY35861.1 MAG: MATE family efflux transporter [Rhizobiales bacterium 65-9]
MLEAVAQDQRPRLWRQEVVATLKLGWPLILGNFAQNMLTLADLILLGWIGSRALGAGALATNLYFATFIFGIGVTAAVSPLLAEELGRKRHSVREVRRTVRQGLWVSVSITLPIWLILWNGEALLLAIGQEPELARDAGHYLRALQWSVLPGLGFLVLRQFLAARERPGWALAIQLAALPLNVGLAWALMFGHGGLPALGMVGAGVATSVVSTLVFAAAAAVVTIDRRFRRYYLFGRFWRADWPRFRKLWRIGLPIGCALAFEVTIFTGATFVMGQLGANELAAHAIALQIAAASFMVPLGLGQAATVRVGLFYGAGEPAGVSRAGWAAFGLTMAYMSTTAIILMAFPHALVGVFLPAEQAGNQAVLSLAATYLLFAAMFQLFDGAQVVAAGMLRGLQDTRSPMIIAGVGYWLVGAPLGVALAFLTPLRGSGIWIGLAAGLAAVAIALVIRWAQRERLGLLNLPSG